MENVGTETVLNVQVTDNLRRTFPEPIEFEVIEGPTIEGDLTEVNSDFGSGSNALLIPSESLAPGGSARIRFTLRLTLNGSGLGPYDNQALVSAIGPDNKPIYDDSDFGEDPDPNGNGDPTEDGENDPTSDAWII